MGDLLLVPEGSSARMRRRTGDLSMAVCASLASGAQDLQEGKEESNTATPPHTRPTGEKRPHCFGGRSLSPI